MSLPRIKKEPSYVNTDLRELKLNFLKSNEKSSTPRKSPKKESPKSSTPRKSPKKESPKSSSVKKRIRDAPLYTSVVSPRPNYHYINDINDINGPDENITFSLIHPDDFERDTFKMPEIKSKSKRKHEIKLPDVITEIHGTHFINEKTKLPPIGKKAGKRRTRKHKSNRRRTLKK